MKTHMKKIFLIAAALFFLCTGVSFAHDWNPGHGNKNTYRHAPGHLYKNPNHWSYRHNTGYYVYRYPGYHGSPYYERYYYPRKYVRRPAYHRNYNGHRPLNTFFFGFSVR
jgi:hypothetical protein